MIQPHGGKLVDRVLSGKKRDEALARAGSLPRLVIDSELVSDVENIATGVYSPLEGFLGADDYRSVLTSMRLRDDVPWTVPIVLDTDRETAAGLKTGGEVLLTAEDGRPVALLHLEEKYDYDKGETVERVFGTRDPAHPGVAKVLGMKDVLLAGPVDLIDVTPTPF
ncbi:MAG: sulfate adenylyltransferase, partial [Candidatus Aminicenantes bacterium]|nr:sulfate adenylyltransferase [Candidatus Aminicenantes bacterium]